MKILKKLNSIKFFIIFLVIGLGIFSYPMILSGFDKVSGDLGDTRLVTYIMEHYFKWFTYEYPHQHLWDIPFLYPYTNTLAFTDVFLGLAIFYIPIRFFVENPFSIMQICLIIVGFLNYFSFYILLKNKFRYNDLASSCGAFLFAFSIIRFFQVIHFQLQLQFYMIFGFYFLLNISKEKTIFKNILNGIISVFFFALQIWTTFYFGYFLIQSLLGILIIGLSFKNSRDKIILYIRNYRKEIIFYILAFIIFILPLMCHYLAVGVTGFTIEESLALKATITSWFLNRSIIDNIIFPFTYTDDIEKGLNIGILTGIVSILGIIKIKSYRKYILIFITSIIVFFSITPLFIIMYKTLIGFGVIRASSRVIFLILPILSIGFAKILNENRNRLILNIIVLLMLIEQIPNGNLYLLSKIEHNSRIEQYTVNPACKVIYLSYTNKLYGYDVNYETDGMWLGLKYGKYTYNGYTGYIPKKRTSEELYAPCIIKIKN